MSDYEKTQRRVIANGEKIQYVAGGSRVRKELSHTQVSKVGEINESEIFYKAPPIVTADTVKTAIETGAYKLPPGCKFIHEQDDEKTTIEYGKRVYDKNSPLLPGDKIEVTDPEAFNFGERAHVKEVASNFDVWVTFYTGGHMNKKYKYTKDQYAIVQHYPQGKYHLGKDDYLYTNIRDDLVKEDKS